MITTSPPGASQDPEECFLAARRHLVPGMTLLQKMAGQGQLERSGDGAEVRLSDGRVLLDLGSYAVTLLGHRHPGVVEAVRAQLDQMPTSTRTLCNPVTATFASELVAALDPARLERVWFGLNGSDVVDLALRLARLVTGRPRVLAVRRGYHGKTLGALAATWSPRYRGRAGGVLSPVTHLEPDEPGAVAREVAAGDVAALILEPVQAEGGVWPLDPPTLRTWSADARATGAFVVCDEIQTGFGRCGPLSTACAHDLRPDAVLLGKGLGGGIMPLSALVATPRLFRPLLDDPFTHSATFSGHPLSCAAGRAALGVVGSLAGRGREISHRFAVGLRELGRRHPATVRDVRGAGLLWGIELAHDRAGAVMLEVGRSGLLFAPCLDHPNVLRLLPPLVMTDDQIDRSLRCLDEAVAAAGRGTAESR